jgi:hypothetical protein
MTYMTTAFRDQSWAARFDKMGDQAEGQFAHWMENVIKAGYVRFGLDRPPLAVHMLPLKIRYTPDFLTSKRLYEVKGFGADRIAKVKVENIAALELWAADMQTRLWFYNSKDHLAWTVACSPDMTDLLADVHLDTFPEGKAYYKFNYEWLDTHGKRVALRTLEDQAGF